MDIARSGFNFLIVIPKLRSEGTQDWDLTMRVESHGRGKDRSVMAHSPEIFLYTSAIVQCNRKIPLSPAFWRTSSG